MNDAGDEWPPFEKLLGRSATAAEREQLRKIGDALELRKNDALWSVLFALQYFDSLYRQYPKAIAGEAAKILVETRKAADAVIQESAQKAHADLARAIATAAQAVARNAARRQMLQWLVAGMALGAALMMIGAIIGAKWFGG